MKSLKQYIVEGSYLGNVKKNIQFDISINKSDHAEGRQGRHGYDEVNFIEDGEIYEMVRRASEKIIDALVYGKIEANSRDSRFIVTDPDTKTNLVCAINGNINDDRMRLVVITVLRGKFMDSKNRYKIILDRH